LVAENVTRTLAGPLPVTLVRNIDFSVSPGECVAITGPSGSGKSSLLYLLGLLDRPTTGRILLEGQDTSQLSEAECARLRLTKLGFVFQFHFLLPEFSALDNVLAPMKKLARLDDAAMRRRASDTLAELGLADKIHRRPDQLSGGERQRVAIARAMANDPLLILADEPTGNLDTKNGRIVFDIFERLARLSGKSVVAVSHDIELASKAFRRVHLVDGVVAEPS
jgi:lipoprotein-releasing system ATP-binding protein